MQLAPRITFARLTQVPLDDVVELLGDPRLARHMPLWSPMSRQDVARWVAAKDAQWAAHGYGPWAVLADGRLVGWAGFQREEVGADLAVVLAPRAWGLGRRVLLAALDEGFGALGLDQVVVSLPVSRTPGVVLARLGFEAAGDATYGGVPFRVWRLTRERWLAGPPEVPAAPP